MNLRCKHRYTGAFVCLLALASGTLLSAQGTPSIDIDQARALAGAISPGDAPGFPITLSRSGQYRLTGDLHVPADTSGIVITAANVTLDLGGHSVRGPVLCRHDSATLEVACDAASRFSAVVGISSVAAAGAVIRNGAVQGFAGLGLHYGEGTVLDTLQIESNAGVGIAGAGHAIAGAIRAARVRHNGGPGIVCEHMHIEHSVVEANGGTGVDCRGAWFVETVSRHNGGQGVAEGPKPGLASFGNRRADADGVAADRLPPTPQGERRWSW